MFRIQERERNLERARDGEEGRKWEGECERLISLMECGRICSEGHELRFWVRVFLRGGKIEFV